MDIGKVQTLSQVLQCDFYSKRDKNRTYYYKPQDISVKGKWSEINFPLIDMLWGQKTKRYPAMKAFETDFKLFFKWSMILQTQNHE